MCPVVGLPSKVTMILSPNIALTFVLLFAIVTVISSAYERARKQRKAKNMLGDKIEKIELSKRLTDTPCIVVSSEYGHTAHMERITKAQAFNTPDKNQAYMLGKKTLEINPHHASMKELLKRIKENEIADEETKDAATLLFESALLSSGYSLMSTNEYISKIDRVLKHALNLDRYEKATPYEVGVDEHKESTTEHEEHHDHHSGGETADQL